MSTGLAANTESANGRPDLTECVLCGTRLRRNDEPALLEVGADSHLTIRVIVVRRVSRRDLDDTYP